MAEYLALYAKGAAGIDCDALARAAALIIETVNRGGVIYACGNGGSAAIANHLLCDFAKNIQTNTALRPRVVSLSAHVELLLAVANDIEFNDVFAFQVRSWAKPGDLVMTISSSGNSENIVRPLLWAKANGISTLALTGFSGGRSREIADVAVHVPANNYGVVEDLHQSVMHLLAQFVRQAHMDPADIPKCAF
jgi:phosphoheptose isomerase